MAEEIKLDLTYEEQIYMKLMQMKTNTKTTVSQLRTIAKTCQEVFQSGRTQNVAVPTFQQLSEKYNQLDVVIGVAQQFVLDSFRKMIDQDKLIATQVINSMLEDKDVPANQKKYIRENQAKVLEDMKKAVAKDREASERGEAPTEEKKTEEQQPVNQQQTPQEPRIPKRPIANIPKSYQKSPKQSLKQNQHTTTTSQLKQNTYVSTELQKGVYNAQENDELNQMKDLQKKMEQEIETHLELDKSAIIKKLNIMQQSATPPTADEVHSFLRQTKDVMPMDTKTIEHTLQTFPSENALIVPPLVNNKQPFQPKTSIVKGSSLFQPKTIHHLQETHIFSKSVQPVVNKEERRGF